MHICLDVIEDYEWLHLINGLKSMHLRIHPRAQFQSRCLTDTEGTGVDDDASTGKRRGLVVHLQLEPAPTSAANSVHGRAHQPSINVFMYM